MLPSGPTSYVAGWVRSAQAAWTLRISGRFHHPALVVQEAGEAVTDAGHLEQNVCTKKLVPD
jgi:hypothetical protein